MAASLLGGAIGGYYFGFASGRSAARTVEAAQDLLVPVDDLRRDRLRRESTRGLLSELAETQATAFASSGEFLPNEGLVFDRDAFVVDAYVDASCHPAQPYGCFRRERWMAVARHIDAPHGEASAVALDIEPAHLAGIPLKREVHGLTPT